MAMIVKHNLQAMNSNRMLGVNMSSQAKSTEKLSSGYKINRAADDAAGLSISEKMRKQIRGLSQASLNAQDGISAVQTAEGALNEVQDMLQRMNELAIKAGNGTMSETDRGYIQNEVDQLITEIDRVSETTKFNETYLLRGDTGSNGNEVTKTAGTSAEVLGKVAGVEIELAANKSTTIQDGAKYTLDVVAASSDTAKITIATHTLAAKVSSVTKTTTGYDITMADGSVKTNVAAAGLATSYGLTDAGMSAGDTVTITKTLKDANAALPANVTIDATTNYTGSANVGDTVDVYAAVAKDGTLTFTEAAKALTLSFQVGADTTPENKISVTMESMNATSIGINGLKVDGANSANADKAVTVIADAIQKVSTQRSALGAVQNRLEHTIANLDNVVENTTAAEAQIRDTDMATEMVKYSNNQILAQAGQAMLAQANQANQGVLSLLQ